MRREERPRAQREAPGPADAARRALPAVVVEEMGRLRAESERPWREADESAQALELTRRLNATHEARRAPGRQMSMSFAVYASAMMNLKRASGSLPISSVTVLSV